MAHGMKLCFPGVDGILQVSLIPLLTVSLVFMLEEADIWPQRQTGFLSSSMNYITDWAELQPLAESFSLVCQSRFHVSQMYWCDIGTASVNCAFQGEAQLTENLCHPAPHTRLFLRLLVLLVSKSRGRKGLQITTSKQNQCQ